MAVREAIIGVRTRLYNQPMAAKPLPNDDRYLAVLRAMSPEQRVRKAAELSELTKALAMAGIRSRFPDIGETEARRRVADLRARWAS